MASFSFDVFIGDLIRSLLVRLEARPLPARARDGPAAPYELMVARGVDCAEFVPATATLLFEHVDEIGKTLEFMRVLVVSSRGLAQRAVRRSSGASAARRRG